MNGPRFHLVWFVPIPKILVQDPISFLILISLVSVCGNPAMSSEEPWRLVASPSLVAEPFGHVGLAVQQLVILEALVFEKLPRKGCDFAQKGSLDEGGVSCL